MQKISLVTSVGEASPFGANLSREGVNFALYSKHATHVALCLYTYPSREPIEEIALDPEVHRTGYVWHMEVKGLPDVFVYSYRLSKKKGKILCSFYQEKNLILDPYAKAVIAREKWGDFEAPYSPAAVFMPPDDFDWESDSPLGNPIKDLVFYEMHIRGMTEHASSQVEHPGTYLGVIEKIPHLVELGVNAVKLMPLQEFNECEYSRYNPDTGNRLLNYWGYSTVNFFSPMSRYASKEAKLEFKMLVKELHRNGIEVILDIVFNHTAEGNIKGPIYSFKGIDPAVYYLLDKREKHINFTGCGNTVNCNHPIVRQLIRECLQYWVTEMHVDGFRFDLAAIMTRGLQGEPLENPPLIEELSQDPILAGTKLIAEPWDSAGLYQLGNFYPKQDRWSEWNDKYRDSVRRFIKGDRGAKRDFARSICGSEQLFHNRSPSSSINFITAHDGFTLHDLVSYNEKHNSSNGEDNRDGHGANFSWNCGFEGKTADLDVLAIRERQMKNFHLSLMLSQGVPMLLMGDEYGHTRGGNNNSWCQDNELNWFLWDELEKNSGFFRFYCNLIALRKRHEIFRLGRFLTDEVIEWHGTQISNPDWNGDTQSIAFLLKNEEGAFYAAFNSHHQPITFHIPSREEGKTWSILIDTYQPSPLDFHDEESAPPLSSLEIEIQSHSAILLYTN